MTASPYFSIAKVRIEAVEVVTRALAVVGNASKSFVSNHLAFNKQPQP